MDSFPKKPNGLSTSSSCSRKASSQIFDCSYPDCHYKSKRVSDVGRHEKIHSPTALEDISCHICFKIFGYLVSFLHHMSSQHGNQLFCPFCKFLAQGLPEFKAHMLAHSFTPRKQMDECLSSRINKILDDYKAQVSKSSDGEKLVQRSVEFRCGDCSTTFTSKGNLVQHQKIKICSKSKPVSKPAPRCQAQTQKHNNQKSDENLQLFGTQAKATPGVPQIFQPRIKIRLEIQPEVHEVNQEKEGEGESGVVKVVRVKRTLFSCQHCNFTTSYISTMRRHHRLHTGERPFKCPNMGCECRVIWPSSLRRHQRKSCPGKQGVQSTTNIETEDNFGSNTKCKNKVQVNMESSSSDMVFACMLCSFIGDSESSALKHSRQHKTAVILLNRI